jgi:hypothetical protein
MKKKNKKTEPMQGLIELVCHLAEEWESKVPPGAEGFCPSDTLLTGAAIMSTMDVYVLRLAQYIEKTEMGLECEVPDPPPDEMAPLWAEFARLPDVVDFDRPARLMLKRAKKRMGQLGVRVAAMLETIRDEWGDD